MRKEWQGTWEGGKEGVERIKNRAIEARRVKRVIGPQDFKTR
jgi:hypothetical protein